MAAKTGRGRPPLEEFTTEQLAVIEALAAAGVAQHRIAAKVGVSEGTLKRRCKDILARGARSFEADLEQHLGVLALGFKHPAVSIFMAKCRLGYREDNPDADPTKKKPKRLTFRVTGKGERIRREDDDDDE